MAETNDTIDGLLAEFRGYAAGMPDSYHVTMSWHDFRRMLDRFEKANKRERGDAAKLREALRECAQYIACVGEIGVGEVTINDNVHLIPGELTQKAIAALAAPPRNCDRPECATTKAAADVWRKEDGGKTAYHEWLLATATEKEGGAK